MKVTPKQRNRLLILFAVFFGFGLFWGSVITWAMPLGDKALTAYDVYVVAFVMFLVGYQTGKILK